MIHPDDAAAMALSFPEAVEQDHHGFPSYRVAKKIFATHPDPGHLNVMLEPDDIRAAILAHPDSCEEQWWGKTLAAVRVSLADVGEDTLRELLEAAWIRRAPKRLR